MELINFENGKTPASAEIMLAFQQNIVNAINGTIVFEGKTNGSVDFSQNIYSATKIEIEYVDIDSAPGDIYNSKTIFAPYSKFACLDSVKKDISQNVTFIRTKTVQMGNTGIDVLSFGKWNSYAGQETAGEDSIYITKVIAYLSAPQSEEVETVLTEEERVIELVKNEYGTDQGVTFNIVNKDGNIYHVSVVDNSTSTALKWYTVDMNNETVTES